MEDTIDRNSPSLSHGNTHILCQTESTESPHHHTATHTHPMPDRMDRNSQSLSHGNAWQHTHPTPDRMHKKSTSTQGNIHVSNGGQNDKNSPHHCHMATPPLPCRTECTKSPHHHTHPMPDKMDRNSNIITRQRTHPTPDRVDRKSTSLAP